MPIQKLGNIVKVSRAVDYKVGKMRGCIKTGRNFDDGHRNTRPFCATVSKSILPLYLRGPPSSSHGRRFLH